MEEVCKYKKLQVVICSESIEVMRGKGKGGVILQPFSFDITYQHEISKYYVNIR